MGTLDIERVSVAKSEALFLKRLLQKFNEEQHKQIQEQLTISQTNEHSKRVRETYWNIKPVRADLQDQRVSLTPNEHSEIKRSLEAGANLVTIDFHRSSSDVHSSLEIIHHFIQESSTRLDKKVPAIMIQVGSISSQTLMTVGSYMFRNAEYLLGMRSAPYLLLHGIDSYRTARLWKEMICFAEDELSLVNGTVKAAVVIDESNWRECDEILFELRKHCAGLRVSIENFDQESMIVQNTIHVGHMRGAHVLCVWKFGNVSEVDARSTAITGFDGMCITKPSDMKKVKHIWNLVMPESNQIWKKRNREC
ncbi:hypothetical protein [Alkalihalobacillus sp. R86527]|uniref:hypothetical protein n=1 Tax=Alkalihalobacillus sp. R86527 TaxID=3093863 RepID=UPI00367095D5